ncbi:LabA-like NYN domain-containing protein [Dictyobacter kobayashii]|uniref:NYN domain-containing protein n=1 Tax=Dictyobacter kobayashii TaxID=2014872 RepID=A0A402AJG2_9CHLR|nr:NYN domain-containing protein [Dictyobacter kobayashii]GCE19203.1 hypothetical protein KDK_30030 [Dictyobacter kobayashii]
MTTQHTHHEHSDADASVVEYPSAPENETTATSSASDTASSEELTTSAEKQEDAASVPAVDSASEQETSAEAITASSDVPESGEVPATPDFIEEATVSSEPSFFGEGQPEASSEAEDESKDEVKTQQDAPQAEEAASISEAHPEKETAADTTLAHDEKPADSDVKEAASHPSEATEEGASEAPATEATSFEQPNGAQEEAAQPVQEVLPEVAVVAEETIIAPEIEAQVDELPVPDTTFPYVEGSDLIDARAEEVRPFTDFIAEFRQAEAALQATLRDSQVEALTRLTTAAADLVNSDAQEQPESIESTESLVTEGKTADASAEEIAAASEEPAAESEEKPAVVANEEEPKPVTRPVSPLLRPASRLRLPRHGSFGRHTREEVQQPVAEENTTSAAKAETPAEAAPEVTPARPARRYRFDRPATNVAGGTVHTPTRSTATSHTTHTVAQRKTDEKLQRAEEAKATVQEQPASVTPAPEPQPQNNKKHTNAATSTQEAESSAASAQPAEQPHGRRRHSQKEQPAAVHEPVVETPTPVVEPASANNKEEIAPEDLPPLEYSELQKASSRRRRRHRSGSSNPASHASQHSESIADEPIAPPAPTPVPAPMPAQSQSPRTPAASAADNNNQAYTIVSGYTVSQMNQGNDVTGPFMGPDPSPARGSVMTRDGRNTRAETRPTPTPSLYPSARSSEGGLSAAAVTQFANVVSQALQTQTDRMVAEFRRISQAPTNVSVTLPPFPSTERVGVFVDVANLLYSARTLRIGVDFGKLLDFLRGNRRLVRAHAYCPTSPQPGDEQMFLQAVKGLGYRITTKNYKTFSSGAKKADLDLDLCMDVVRLVDGGAVDCIVLVSGDSDFMPMLDYCSDHGVRVEVAAFDEAMSATLRQSCDLFINLSMLEEIRA